MDKLNQLFNKVEIIGTLKDMEKEYFQSKNFENFLKLTLTVTCKINNKIHEHNIKFIAKEGNKLYKSYETIINQYKYEGNLEDGEKADRVQIIGELKYNEYYNQNINKIVSFNEIKGSFCTRLKDGDTSSDKTIATIETVIDNFVEEVDKDKLPTGNYLINCFTIGYRNDYIKLNKVVLKKDLVESFMNLYSPGQTGKLTYIINNYVEVIKDRKNIQNTQHGFGSDEEAGGIITEYINNLELIGGDIPLMPPKEYSPGEIKLAKKIYELKQQSYNLVSDLPPSGFGVNIEENKAIDIDDEDLPF